jgi:hypothetical protein
VSDKSFVFSFVVSDEFLRKEPDAAARWIEVAKQHIAGRLTAAGPRGGTYVLVTTPDQWQSSNDYDYDWMHRQTRYVTHRMGRYVRPSRAPRPLKAVTFATITIPVVEGTATLPDGRTVETTAQYVDVPVLA